MILPDDILEVFKNTEYITVLTGAGISAESGISTFRGKEGLWSRFKPEELASMEAFLANPEMVWEWYQYRRDVLSRAAPNPGHAALHDWEQLVEQFVLVTQNVDGLHQAAGSKDVMELHGNIKINRCRDCGRENTDETVKFSGIVPTCDRCGGMLRPGVVWFGEYLPEDVISAAFEAADHCDLFLSVGTSSIVYPAASLPEIALASGATVIEVNTEETPLTPSASLHLHGTSGSVLPELLNAFRQVRGLTSSLMDS